jgi:hypothetical protein
MNADRTAPLHEIQDLAADIACRAYHTGETAEEAGAFIASQMDGTQPWNLVSGAIRLVNQRGPRDLINYADRN